MAHAAQALKVAQEEGPRVLVNLVDTAVLCLDYGNTYWDNVVNNLTGALPAPGTQGLTAEHLWAYIPNPTEARIDPTVTVTVTDHGAYAVR
jgi:hypothetical protein